MVNSEQRLRCASVWITYRQEVVWPLWAPESLRPLFPGEPLSEPPVGTHNPEWGRRRDCRQ